MKDLGTLIEARASRALSTASVAVRAARPVTDPNDRTRGTALITHLLRMASTPQTQGQERAVMIIDRLSPQALDTMVPRLQPEELQQLAVLVFGAPSHYARLESLGDAALALLLQSVSLAHSRAFITTLNEERRSTLISRISPKHKDLWLALGFSRSPNSLGARLRTFFGPKR